MSPASSPDAPIVKHSPGMATSSSVTPSPRVSVKRVVSFLSVSTTLPLASRRGVSKVRVESCSAGRLTVGGSGFAGQGGPVGPVGRDGLPPPLRLPPPAGLSVSSPPAGLLLTLVLRSCAGVHSAPINKLTTTAALRIQTRRCRCSRASRPDMSRVAFLWLVFVVCPPDGV